MQVISKAFLTPDIDTGGVSYAQGRLARYDRYWNLYTNTAYDNLIIYLKYYPQHYKLYRKTRGLRNPLAEYARFWKSNVWGGALDPKAGSGKEIPSSIPIITDNQELRPAIAKVWEWSNWAQKKQIAVLHGAILGDTFIEVVDKPSSGKVFLQVRWPGDVKRVDWDDFGNIKYIEYEYTARDADGLKPYKYTEKIEHPSFHKEGSRTIYRTYKNGEPYAYDGENAEWEAPFDFVPVVHIPFIDIGIGWGMVGFQQSITLIDDTCAKASIISDQLAKELTPPLVTYGVLAKDLSIKSTDDSVPVIELHSPPSEAKVEPLIFDMNIGDALASLQDDMATLKAQLPELQYTHDIRSGVSAGTLEQAYAPLISQVRETRNNFDNALVRAHRMAIAIGGERGYDSVFSPFDMKSNERGLLDHAVGHRPVLPYSKADRINENVLKWQMVASAVAAKVPLQIALREILGWDDDKIDDMMQEIQRQMTFIKE